MQESLENAAPYDYDAFLSWCNDFEWNWAHGNNRMKERPSETRYKQALAAVGQCELMFLYDKFFGEYNNSVAQVLLTKNVVINDHSRQNVMNTFQTLLEMDIIPIVNENDTVAIDEIVGANFGDNDNLSAIVADLVGADLLVILTDIDGLYDSDPRKNPDAVKIPVVTHIDDNIRIMAGGSGSNRGTGGMATKITAAAAATQAGINCCVMTGKDPENLYRLINGEQMGTMFLAQEGRI